MVHTYCLREDVILDESGKEYVVYGIEAVGAAGTVLLAFSDIFFDKTKAKHLVTMCNEKRLDLLHLADIVEDILTEQYTPCV